MFCSFCVFLGSLSGGMVARAVEWERRDHSRALTEDIEIRKGGDFKLADSKQKLMRRVRDTSSKLAAVHSEAKAAHLQAHDLLEDEDVHEEATMEHVETDRKPTRKRWCLPDYYDDINCQRTTTTTTTTTVVHCQWAPWNEWEQCTKTCGFSGESFRIRNKYVVGSPGGRRCFGPSRETEDCNQFECPTNDEAAAAPVATTTEKKEQKEAPAEESSGGGSSLYLIIGVVVLLVLVGGGAYFAMGDGMIKPKTNNGLADLGGDGQFPQDDDYGDLGEDYDGQY
jgi:hypothetical protein